MTSYFIHTHGKSRLYVLHTNCTFFLFYSFLMKINVIKVIYSFSFILDTGLNSHANIENCVEFSIIMWGRPFTLASY